MVICILEHDHVIDITIFSNETKERNLHAPSLDEKDDSAGDTAPGVASFATAFVADFTQIILTRMKDKGPAQDRVGTVQSDDGIEHLERGIARRIDEDVPQVSHVANGVGRCSVIDLNHSFSSIYTSIN